ncbi:MAG: flagellar hook-basal body complex protein FliE [Candidatus Dactylopiibacterium carminicum]|uniref:Flagellar hook-basal body complex protein FliE n=1 Tax=Candidatus Dactylopiibacterium carminicum TaxID=857335 RepID=A0A272ES72_9RHOO|nr:flagellar hook-basal body complex protein FliE [Candidatus Dactylopiibacterium carminicum]KAF7598670.1 flagellar hook-basal body complex protein FliE [Candidatus Dactylopiibacterium carminicum]PAS92560.1 MAG: flagellar hook-basal body complex protein FliE [Candidatus Dactylopiibacterium carminicum]PAS98538.1 MAG: flagellar hook-basal body complex protein FliE [Candidatus Dactylopiibacterium carminicum]
MDTRAIEQMLSQLRSTADAAASKPAGGTAAPGGVDFAQALQSAMQEVSQAQQSAQQMAQDFSSGNSEVNLQDVMVNLQKANLSFQQMVQVRNKLVTAYQDIMNMPV